MATLTLSLIRSMVRDELNEQNTNVLTNTELNSIANDGYKDVAVKGLGYELTKTITTVDGEKIFTIPTTTAVAFKVNFLDHNADGATCIDPRNVGFHKVGDITSGKGTPGYYFQWGRHHVILDPPCDTTAASATTTAYCSCYPAAVMSADGDTPASLPAEFHESVFEFTVAFAALKLKRWMDFGLAYNRYISNLQRKRFEYFHKVSDKRIAREVPDSVTVEYKNG
jgi:hypothetical protein